MRNWIFDLDNTLYRADNGIFAQIEARMTAFRGAAARAWSETRRAQVQKDLYRQYGTTLNGLMRVHESDPEPYLDYVHDIDL